MRKFGKSFLIFLTLALLAMPLMAAGGQAAGPAGSSNLGTGFINYPIQTDETLTFWMALNINISANYVNFSDTPLGRYREEKTGVKVTYLHPATGTDNEQFNLIIASGDLPDIMVRSWLAFPGGPEKAIEDGIILRKNDIFRNWGPNISAYFNAHPDFDKQVKTDEGSYYAFYYLRGDDGLVLTNGPQFRKDWLDEMGLATPVTLDDWHRILTAFKNRGVQAPFSWTQWDRLPFFYTYGEWPRGFRLDNNGRVVFSPIQPGYRQTLELMAQWYSEGLLDADFPTLTTAVLNQKMLNNNVGATAHQVGQGMGVWTNTARQTNPSFRLTAVPYPVVNRGDTVNMIYATNHYTGSGCAAITTRARNVELAARFLDWNYTEEGHNLNNFGIEGITYNWVNGYPQFTDYIFNHPQGWPPSQAFMPYALAADSGPLIQDIRYFEQYMDLPEQAEALRIWAIPNIFRFMLPPVTPSPTESTEFAQIMQAVNTYVQEMEFRFILGTEPLTNWNNYVETINRMGINRAVELRQIALDRYNRR